MKKKLFFILFVWSLMPGIPYAQIYEIQAVNKGNGVVSVEVRVKSGTPPDTGNYVTDLVFGIKWQSSYNVNLSSTITTDYTIEKSDVKKSKNGFDYQAFYANSTPFNFPANWSLNHWVEIMSISNTLNGSGNGIFEIAENGFDATTDLNIGIDLADKLPLVNGKAECVLMAPAILSNVTDYFRTIASGNWNSACIWESSSDNTNWHAATRTPDFNANTILIPAGHVVRVTANVTVDQISIIAGGTLIVDNGVILTVR